MADIAEIGIKVEAHGLEETTVGLERLADAARRAKEAIDSLNGAEHGGIEIKVCGQLAHVEIKPVNG